MKNKTISISEGMFDKLRSVANASGLIECLLQEHFKIIPEVKKENLQEEIKKIETDANNKIEIFKKEIQTIEKTEAEKEAEVFLNEQKQLSKLEEFMNRVNIDTGFKISQATAEEYFLMFNEGKTDYFKFVENLKKENDNIPDESQ